jgi:hypothetical protein
MAELNVKITAQDQASPTLKAVGKELTNFGKGVGTVQTSLAAFATGTLPAATGALGTFSSGLAQVFGKMGALIGTGGMAGLAAAAVTLGVNLEDLKTGFADWVTGMDDAIEGLDKLDPKTQAYIQTLKGLQKQLALANLAGVERAAAEFGLKQKEVSDLERQVEERTRALARLEELRKVQAKGIGISGIGYVFPGLKQTEESIKNVTEQLADLTRQLGIARTEGAIAVKTLGGEEAKEAKKLLEEQAKEAEKFAKALREINREGERRKAMAELPVMRESEFLMAKQPLPTILTPEQIQKTTEGITEGLQDAAFKGMQTTRKTTDEIFQYYTDQGIKAQKKIEDMREDAWREQKQQYEKMIDGIRDGAGRVFDAMLTKGESVFKSLANFAEGVLQTMLRNIFQNAVQALVTANAGLMKLFAGAGGAGGGGAGAIAGGSMAALGGLIPFFNRGGGGAGAGGYAQSGGITYIPGGGGAAPKGFATGAAGSALMGGGALAGQMLAMDAFRRGSAIEGLAGGALAGASIGTMIAPGVGTAIGAGVGAIAGLITGLFGGGAKRRAEEAAKRAAMLEAGQFAAPETISRFGIWGAPGEYAVETDLTGQIRGIGKQPQVNNVINVQLIDARHAREAGEVIGQVVSQQILAGGGLLSDNIQWAAS